MSVTTSRDCLSPLPGIVYHNVHATVSTSGASGVVVLMSLMLLPALAGACGFAPLMVLSGLSVWVLASGDASILMGRRLRSALGLVKPYLHKGVEREQERQKAACDPHIVIHSFNVGDPVYALNYRPGQMWEPGC